LSLSKVEAKVRVEVRDEKGKVVKVIEERTKSFTQHFFTLLVASQFYTPNVPQLGFYDALGMSFGTGYSANPAMQYVIGVPQQLFCASGCPLLPAYANSIIPSPGIWFGVNQCSVTYTSSGPCGTIPSGILSPSQFSYTSAVAQGQGGWQLQYSQTWTNVSSNTINVASVALVLAAVGSTLQCFQGCPQGWSPGQYFLYSMIVDNINPALTLNPGWYITATYTITFPT
jgi:hypothetical protein